MTDGKPEDVPKLEYNLVEAKIRFETADSWFEGSTRYVVSDSFEWILKYVSGWARDGFNVKIRMIRIGGAVRVDLDQAHYREEQNHLIACIEGYLGRKLKPVERSLFPYLPTYDQVEAARLAQKMTKLAQKMIKRE